MLEISVELGPERGSVELPACRHDIVRNRTRLDQVRA